MEEWLIPAVWALAPTLLVGAFFWFLMRAILRADRTERRVFKQIEAEERAKAGLPLREDA